MFAGVQLLAITADRLKQFAFISMVGILAPGSSADLLLLNLFMQLPILAFTPLVGAMLDRWNKSDAIVGACIARAALLLAVPSLFGWSGSIYALYAAAAVLSIADLMFGPARAAMLPEVVAPERLLRANAVFWVLGVIGTMAGLLGGGWMFDFLSWESTFYANSLVYLAAATVMLPVMIIVGQRRDGPARGARSARGPVAAIREVFESVADSVRLIRADQHIAVSLITQSALFAMGGVLAVIAVARVQELAPADERAVFLGIIGAALVLGMIIGSGVLALLRERVSVERTIAVATIVSGVAIAGLGRTEHLMPLCIWAGVLGLAISPVFVVTETLIQRQSPRGHLGRVFAAREALIKTAYLGAAVLATGINAIVSKASILVALGLFLALLGVVLERTRWLRTDETEEQEGS
jgi:MFS family permease